MSGDGEVGALVRAYIWARTALGRRRFGIGPSGYLTLR